MPPAASIIAGSLSWQGGDRLTLALPDGAQGPLAAVSAAGSPCNPGLSGGRFPVVLGQTTAYPPSSLGGLSLATIACQDASGAQFAFDTAVYGPLYGTFAFSLRSLLPVSWDTGPRAISDLPPGPPPPLSNFGALTSAIAEALTEFGGAYLTRLTQTASPGEAVLRVERAQGLPASGHVQVDGVAYAYEAWLDPGGGNAQLTGISVLRGGLKALGVQASHLEGAQVAFLSAPLTDYEVLKNSFFLDTASGSELTALGRNLGVLHSPSVSGDDQYRAIIKAIAYGPKTSIYGLTLALDAILGPGSYTLSEDPAGAPAEVFIGVDYGSVNDPSPFGKAYICGAHLTSAGPDGTLSLPGPVFGYGPLFPVGPDGEANQAQDYAMLFGSDAATATGPDTLTFGSQVVPAPTITLSVPVLPQDVGAFIRLDSGAQVGRYQIAKVLGAKAVAVHQGRYDTGALSVSGGKSFLRIPLPEGGTAESSGPFAFPRDIGRQVCIFNTQGQNQGIRTISAIYDPFTGSDLASFATQVRQRSNLCELSGPPVQPQIDVSLVLLPVFPSQAGLSYRMAGNLTTSRGPTGSTLTPRQNPPASVGGYSIDVSDVLSSLVAPSSSTTTNLLDINGPTFDQYPLYIDAPFGVLDAYLSDLTAAGIRPTLTFT